MNLNEIAELSWQKLFPSGSDETLIPKESFMRTAFAQFSFFTWLAFVNEKNQEGYAEVPSYLLSETELVVTNNEMDISGLITLKSLPQDQWLQNIGGTNCGCKYIKSTINLSQLLCMDDSLPDTTKTYFIQGKKIKFPKGVHKTPLSITYANAGESVSGYIEVAEDIAAQVMDKLDFIYAGKVAPADVTNNTNGNV